MSCYPRKFVTWCKQQPECLYAANGSKVQTFGTIKLKLNLGLRKEFLWTFVIADVTTPILGADFLESFALLLDVRNRRLIEQRSVSAIQCSTQVGTHLTPISANTPFYNVIMKFPRILSPNINTHKLTTTVVHTIETKGPPVFAKARRLNPEKLKALKAEFQELLQQNIIRPSKSPWSSPIHIVTKADGKFRICGDYRRLNAVTVPDRYSIPHLHDFAMELHGKTIFSKIDLKKAYHQIKIEDSDIQKTAVITPIGLYEYNYMCFGLKNAAQTFQRYIDDVLRGLSCCFAYIDDILVASTDETTHEQDLTQVFKRLDDHGLVINHAKCVFGAKELQFLGFLVTAKGISPAPSRVKHIAEYTLPKTVDGLRRFLAMLNFYHRFFKHAATVQAKLYHMVKGKPKKDKSVLQWNDETREAFLKCLDVLKEAVILAHPAADAKLSLMVDASDIAIGAELHQTIDGTASPLGFFSRRLTPTEQRYSTYDRELLAIYSAVRHFRHLIEGSQCVIFTDHKPLCYAFLQHSDRCNPRQIRHLEFISQFSTDIRYISGSQNVVADAMSRVDAITLGCKIDSKALASAQADDTELKDLLKGRTGLELKQIQLETDSPKVYCDISTGNVRLYLPEGFRREAFTQVHNISHPGIKGTTKLIRERFVWPRLAVDCKEWVASCIQCQKSKILRHTRSPLATFKCPDTRFAEVHLDIVGPLPPSRGFQYLLTCIDRFTRWPEAYPIPDQTAQSVAEAFYTGWIARFGVPVAIITDQGRQFESELFSTLNRLLGIERKRTCAYNPRANGLVENFHRHLKQTLICILKASQFWVEKLPLALLGIRTSFKEDIAASTAELVYGSPLRLPGDFFCDSSDSHAFTRFEFLQRLRSHMKELRPIPTSAHAANKVFVQKELMQTPFVFVRIDSVRKPLTQPYDGPYKVISRHPKHFTLNIAGHRKCIAIDRIKPAFFQDHPTSDEVVLRDTDRNSAVTTRSGRRVRFVVPYQA